MAKESQNKEKTISESSKREEEISNFWYENKIFEKSLEKESPRGEFVFYDGPPFATGLPHYGSLLSSIIKDVIPRYKTMRGYNVRRRWGWDCHGLPIENMIEKELGLKAKKDIEELGIAAFNEACRASVLRYADGWKEYVDRIGRWSEYDNAYKTMDNSYMESVWWAIKKMHDKKLLYEGRKVLLYCPHCETPLAKAEIQQDNSYKDITEEAVTVKLKVKEPEKHGLPENTYLLAWTTTPWTLPGNVALAVGRNVSYTSLRVKGSSELFIVASDLVKPIFADTEIEIVNDDMTGADLISLEYEPLYEVEKVVNSGKKAWYVTDADFVTTEEGTGIVHTAVIYGEDDYNLGQEKDLPMVPLLNAGGMFNDDAPELVRGVYFKKAEKIISDDLDSRGLLFSREMHTHSYPHCHRCNTPLLYNAITSWFINIQKVKKRLINLNEKVNWFPAHLKHGRFLNILKDAPDWTISRNRYWASPLPIWRCEKCSEVKIVGSLDDIKESLKKSGNKYFVMRHGGSESNERNILNSTDTKIDTVGLTKKGKDQIDLLTRRMRKDDFDLIITSPLTRTLETTDIVAKHIGLPEEKIIVDDRLIEIQGGVYDGQSISDYNDFYSESDWFTKTPEGGESPMDVKKRMGEFLYEIDNKYSDKKILIVTHGGPGRMLFSAAHIMPEAHLSEYAPGQTKFITTGEIHELDFTPMPHNANYEVDIHRPYIDEIFLKCSCGESMRRIPEVVDGWVESGSMPFAEYHYPFENRRAFKKRSPGDFVAEYVAQTRTWFYYMHAVSGILFRKPSFTNVVTTGNILAEDGTKMSKSKGNYTDPLKNLDRYGADALRYYLMGSTVMQGEDVRFLDDELREAHNRVVNILANILSFYELYAQDQKPINYKLKPSKHLLDRWILARLYQLSISVTKYLDEYDTVRAARDIRVFIEDFSTWYIRRSRERFKLLSDDGGESVNDRENAINTTQIVLFETAKIIAPLMPFLAEKIYKSVKGELESVHLEKWPEYKSVSKEGERLIEQMRIVREVVSHGLEARARAGIKVRQPLSKLSISSMDLPDEYLFLIGDEVNVKEVIKNEKMVERVRLDTEITDELKEEGDLRDFVRHIQGLRKEMNLDQNHIATLTVGTDSTGSEFINKFSEEIKKATSLDDIQVVSTSTGAEVKIGEQSYSLSIEK